MPEKSERLKAGRRGLQPGRRLCTVTEGWCFPWGRTGRGDRGRWRVRELTYGYMKEAFPKKASWRDGETPVRSSGPQREPRPE